MRSVRFLIIVATVLFGSHAHVVSRMIAAPTPEPLGQSSRLTSLVISEVMYHPSSPGGDEDLEFVELFNALDTPEDIGGYRLSGNISFTFPPGTTIPGRGFLVVARNPLRVQAAYGLTGVFGPFDNNSDLPNDTGLMQLRHRTGAIFLEFEYGTASPWPVAADGTLDCAGTTILRRSRSPCLGSKREHWRIPGSRRTRDYGHLTNRNQRVPGK